ncbi:DUF6215 domain-containing protein [Streptomyces sp. A15ISP2-DRY2]|uniref:DUF6215 domain-containing protein n=1 Tax=Streptomyces ortus TaxID=2867268 RepID=A0ABT3V6Q5_9ACTN|nr:DUF6215 domain-containing protein [Streptomyces ortus]
MLGFLIRLLPFWVREPLLIVIGSVFGVRIMYLAAHDRDWVAAGIGAAFLVLAAVSVHTVIRALRAQRSPRRNPSPTASASASAGAGAGESRDGVAVGPVTQAQTQPPPQQQQQQQQQQLPHHAPPHAVTAPPSPRTPEKEPNAWGQAAAAVGLFGALAVALWALPRYMPADDNAPPPPTCSDESSREALPKAYEDSSRPVTGEELCEALNRPDLAELLGTPGETATSVSSSNNTAPLTDEKVAQPEATVAFDTYTVNVSATYNKLSIDQYVKLMEFGDETDVRAVTVAGRPAVLASAHTMKFEIDLGGSASGGPVEEGPLARSVTVALDRDDRGGSCDISVWSTSGTLPNDSALLDIAEKVLPELPARS